MIEKLYEKSEVRFAVIFIIAYVIGDSYFIQMSEEAGLKMVYTIPYNLVLLGILFVFIKKMHLFEYYGINKVKCKAGKLLYYVPLIIIATVDIWTGFYFKMNVTATIIYFTAMIMTGIVEEMLFRGLLFKAMSRSNIKSAIIVTSITFGFGHIVNLINGHSTDYVATICQIFYAVAIGFLLAAVLYVGKSIIPCVLTHSMLNALSTFLNEPVVDKIQIPFSIVLCVVSVVSAMLIFRNANHE